MVLLEDAQPRADGRRVGEDEDLPAVCGRVRRDHVLEPLELLVVDGDLVARVLGGTEDSRAEADEQGLLGDLPLELHGRLAMDAQHRFEVGLVRGELVDALQVMVAADHFVRHVERGEELGRQLMARGRASEEFVRLVRAYGLGLAKVTQAHERRRDAAALGILQNRHEVLPPGLIVLHLARVEVQVAQDCDQELVVTRDRALLLLDAQLVLVVRLAGKIAAERLRFRGRGRLRVPTHFRNPAHDPSLLADPRGHRDALALAHHDRPAAAEAGRGGEQRIGPATERNDSQDSHGGDHGHRS
mmetsp:Transcript_37820/g.96033  ORF Transcript_37820/g.96033 Transcript_37820/m.96033 type:complete len:301 (-) Transcript_37820:1-903(-)